MSSVCAACGMSLVVDTQLCSHHTFCAPDDTWAASNRVWCDFLHRGRSPARLPAEQRDDDWLPSDTDVG